MEVTVDLNGMDLKHNSYSEVVTRKDAEIKAFVQLIFLRCVRNGVLIQNICMQGPI